MNFAGKNVAWGIKLPIGNFMIPIGVEGRLKKSGITYFELRFFVLFSTSKYFKICGVNALRYKQMMRQSDLSVRFGSRFVGLNWSGGTIIGQPMT